MAWNASASLGNQASKTQRSVFLQVTNIAITSLYHFKTRSLRLIHAYIWL